MPHLASTEPAPAHRHDRADRGNTLVEFLIAIVLMGMTITATMTALTTTIQASSVDRDHANAHAWLQTAADVLYARIPHDCAVQGSIDMADNEAIRLDYENTVQQTENPENWPASDINVVDVQYWRVSIDPTTSRMVEGWGYECDTEQTDLQQLQIEVRAPDGTIVEQVEVIIGE